MTSETICGSLLRLVMQPSEPVGMSDIFCSLFRSSIRMNLYPPEKYIEVVACCHSIIIPGEEFPIITQIFVLYM